MCVCKVGRLALWELLSVKEEEKEGVKQEKAPSPPRTPPLSASSSSVAAEEWVPLPLAPVRQFEYNLYIVLYCTVLYSIVLYCIVLFAACGLDYMD